MKVVMNSLQLSISFHGQRDAPCRQAASAVASNLFPCATVSTDNCFSAKNPYVSDRMMAHSFDQIAPLWAQSETTMVFSRHKFAGRKYDACAISTQLENVVHSANVVRRDQRAFRHGFTRARRGRKWKNAVAFASVSGTAAVVAFRLRSSRLSACTSLCRPPNR